MLARVLGIEHADEARVTEANEHVGIYYLTVEARGAALQLGSRAASAASTARAVRRGALGGNL